MHFNFASLRGSFCSWSKHQNIKEQASRWLIESFGGTFDTKHQAGCDVQNFVNIYISITNTPLPVPKNITRFQWGIEFFIYQIYDIVEPQFLELSNINHLMSERVQNFM